jgi:spore maturation protein CgeB
MKILYFGPLEWCCTGLLRMESLRAAAGHLYAVDSRIALGEYAARGPWTRLAIRAAWPPLVRRVGRELAREARRYRPDLIWVDQGMAVPADAVRDARDAAAPGARAVHYTPDSIRAPGWRAARGGAFAAYDVCFTTKPGDLDTYRALGARRVHFTLQGYDPRVHRPMEPGGAGEGAGRFGCDVAFVGQRMPARARSLRRLAAEVPCRLALYGRHWGRGSTGAALGPLHRGWVSGDDYARALSSAKICLGFLNQEVQDCFTTRSFEIPACGGFMLAERTEFLRGLFEEDREAAYFGSDDELCSKVRFYLGRDGLRRRIARAGLERARRSGYTWGERVLGCLEAIGRPDVAAIAATRPAIEAISQGETPD